MRYAMGYDEDGQPTLHKADCQDLRNLRANTIDRFDAPSADAALNMAADIHSADLDCFDGEFAHVIAARPTARTYIDVKPCAK